MSHIGERPAMANLLRRLEAEGETAGWDSDLAVPHIFFIFKDQETGKLLTKTAAHMMDAVRVIVGDGEVPAGRALMHVADKAKEVATTVRVEGGVTGDMVTWDGCDLAGMAFRSEGWMLETTTAEDMETAQTPFAVSRHPNRIEYRFVLAVERDGLMWFVERRRKADSVQEIRTAWAESDSMDAQFGNIHRGLVGLLNATTGEDIKLTERAGLPE